MALAPLYGASAGAAFINGSGELQLMAWQDTTTKLVKRGSANFAGQAASVATTGGPATGCRGVTIENPF